MYMKLPSIGAIVALTVVTCVSKASALSGVYEVQPGDSLWEIATRFSTTVGQIKKLNRLRSARIYPGQKLQVGSRIKEFLTPNGPYYWSQPQRHCLPQHQAQCHHEPQHPKPWLPQGKLEASLVRSCP